jgi:hypothetical protein
MRPSLRNSTAIDRPTHRHHFDSLSPSARLQAVQSTTRAEICDARGGTAVMK